MANIIALLVLITLLIIWYNISKGKKEEQGFSLEHESNVTIHPYGDENLTWFSVAENLPKLIPICSNKDDFKILDIKVSEESKVDDLPFTPLSQKNIKVYEMATLLIKIYIC